MSPPEVILAVEGLAREPTEVAIYRQDYLKNGSYPLLLGDDCTLERLGRLLATRTGHADPYTVNVGVDDGNGGSASQTFTWMVNDASVNGQGLLVSANEGAPADGVTLAMFQDANPYSQPADFSVSINWADGGPVDAGTVTLSARVYSVLGSHIYLHAGTFTVTATVTDTGGSTVQTTSTATVAVAPLTARGIDVPLPSCLPSSCQTDPTPGFQVAAFVNANPYEPASSYSATIVWASAGSTTGNIVGRRGTFIVYSLDPVYTVAGIF